MSDQPLGAEARAFLSRHVAAPAPAPAPPAKPKLDLVAPWVTARDKAADQVALLARIMRATKHPAYVKVAEHGLSGVTGRLQVGLHAALADAEGRDPKAVGKALRALSDMRTFVATDRTVELLDANPLRAPVRLRATLTPALDRLERTLRGALT